MASRHTVPAKEGGCDVRLAYRAPPPPDRAQAQAQAQASALALALALAAGSGCWLLLVDARCWRANCSSAEWIDHASPSPSPCPALPALPCLSLCPSCRSQCPWPSPWPWPMRGAALVLVKSYGPSACAAALFELSPIPQRPASSLLYIPVFFHAPPIPFLFYFLPFRSLCPCCTYSRPINSPSSPIDRAPKTPQTGTFDCAEYDHGIRRLVRSCLRAVSPGVVLVVAHPASRDVG